MTYEENYGTFLKTRKRTKRKKKSNKCIFYATTQKQDSGLMIYGMIRFHGDAYHNSRSCEVLITTTGGIVTRTVKHVKSTKHSYTEICARLFTKTKFGLPT